MDRCDNCPASLRDPQKMPGHMDVSGVCRVMRFIPHNSVLCISPWSYCILVHDRCNSRPCQLQQKINGRCKHRSVRVVRPVSTQGDLFIHDRYTWSSTKLTNVDVFRLSVKCLLKKTFIKLSSR